MATKVDDSTLEVCLNAATNPAHAEEDQDAIAAFCDQVNRELEGPHYAVRLLAHKVQSPMEREALYALSTLEACVKNCGKRFHQEIGKFRFLNEIIKVISPKYLGTKTSDKVKRRCIELMYSWNKGLPHEPKISDAYKMLKQQGIVKEDPIHMDKVMDDLPNPLPDEDKRATFEDEEKSKLLSRLLKSKNPDDLQAANRLIKNMVKQDAERMEKVSRRINELEAIHENVKLLAEMVKQYNPSSTTESEREMMKELYEALEKMRPKLFRLASDTDDNDTDALNTILKANDEVSAVMQTYKKTVEGIQIQHNGQMDGDKKGGSSLLDLAFDPSAPPTSPGVDVPVGPSSLLDDEMLTLGLQSSTVCPQADNLISELDDIFSSATAASQQINKPGGGSAFTASGLSMMTSTVQSQATTSLTYTQPLGQHIGNSLAGVTVPSPAGNVNNDLGTEALTGNQVKAMEDLDLLGQTLMQQNIKDTTVKYSFNPTPKAPPKIPLNQMATSKSQSSPVPVLQPLASVTQPAAATHPPPVSLVSGSSSTTVTPTLTNTPTLTTTPTQGGIITDVQSLTDIFVPLESIQPGDAAPVTAYDKNGLKALIHVAKGRPRDDVLVMVISVISTNTVPVKAFVFQAAVPKIMKVKLQPPSATELPAFNPILPPSAITQIMLVANPQKEKIRLKFKVSYSLNEQTQTDLGDIDSLSVV